MKLSLVVIVVSLLLLTAASGRSQEPEPRATGPNQGQSASEEKPSQKHPDQTDNNRQNAYGPSAATLAGVAKDGNTDPPDDATREEQRHNRVTESLEERSICLNAIIAFFTFGTFVVFIFVLRANQKSANASIQSAKTYAAMLTLQARPLLRVRKARLISERPYYRAEYVVVNVGGSKAEIISFTHALAVGLATPSKFGIESFELTAGATYLATVQGVGTGLRDEIVTSIKLIGTIIYTDVSGVVRETSFDRSYRFDVKMFERIPNWDTEHED
jgi:hypothetical protein